LEKFGFAWKVWVRFGFFHGSFILLHWRLGRGRINVPVHRGGPLFSLRARTSDLPMFTQTFIDRQYDFAHPSPRTIVDAGANIGAASVYFAIRFPEARIIALEPDPSNYEMLCANISTFPKVTARCAALWSHRTRLHLTTAGRAKSEIEVSAKSSRHSEPEVDGVSVADLLAEYEVPTVDLLKVDVEGSEKEIFKDAARWIGKIGTVVVELHEHLAPGCTVAFENATRQFDHHFSCGENCVAMRAQPENVPKVGRILC
jgi:FkbM family methyltransferase